MIRRTTLENHGISPVAGEIVLLGSLFKEAMELIYQELRKVMRLVKPEPIKLDFGDRVFAEECMYVGMHAWVCVCACVCLFVYAFYTICMYVCMYVCMYIFIYIYVCMYVCI